MSEKITMELHMRGIIISRYWWIQLEFAQGRYLWSNPTEWFLCRKKFFKVVRLNYLGIKVLSSFLVGEVSESLMCALFNRAYKLKEVTNTRICCSKNASLSFWNINGVLHICYQTEEYMKYKRLVDKSKLSNPIERLLIPRLISNCT